jgi:hypothetical protein
MFLKIDRKIDKQNGNQYLYYKLCESYRIGDKIRHRTLLHLGNLDELQNSEERKLLADRIEQLLRGEYSLFTAEIPQHIEKLAHQFYQKIKQEKANQNAIAAIEAQTQQTEEADYQEVDLATLSIEDVREMGSEWICKQALDELALPAFLAELGWDEKQINTALIQIISKAVYPASERKTAQWLKDNTALNELFFLKSDAIDRFHLYKSSKTLYRHKEKIERFLSVKTNEIFDLNDKIILYDLSNTYFEGRKDNSELAQFYISKEKRSDAKLIALALVVNGEGFVKYSSIHKGNISDSETLEALIQDLSQQSSFSDRKPVIVIDAGIATEANIAMMKTKGYQYVCVTRRKLKDYQTTDSEVVHLQDRNGNSIDVRWVRKNGDSDGSDSFLYVHSALKAIKEKSMATHFSVRYEAELKNLSQSIHKKGGIKNYGKVLERIGRIKERYPAANKHYQIDVIEKEGIAVELSWRRIESKNRSQEGVYFIRTNIENPQEAKIWDIYNTIREIEASFRILKSDLHLRPVFHKKDEFTEAHLYLSILAYTIVNTIRYRLKKHGIKHNWKNIVRIMNTQKAATIFMKGKDNQRISYRVCSKPILDALEIYRALGYKAMPFYRQKFVLPKI